MISAPEPRWICEAQHPGKASHHFETYGEEAARAYCELRGWDFIRVYREGSHSDRPAQAAPPLAKLITAKQLKCLIVEAQITYRHFSKLGIEQPPFDDWRAQVCQDCAGTPSLRALPASKFAKVRNRLRELRGAAPTGSSHEGKRQSREQGDTLQSRQQQLFLMAHELGTHARAMADAGKAEPAITVAYLLTIARAKNKAHLPLEDLEDLIKLPTSRLQQLLYTLRNRIAAKEGRGDKNQRNKKQP